MDIQEVKEYNKIVIDTAREVCRPWKWATFVLSLLLAGMIALYFFNPSIVDVEQSLNNSNSVNTLNSQQG